VSAICGLDAAVICLQEDWKPLAAPSGPTQADPADRLADAANKLGVAVYRAPMCTRPDIASLGVASHSGPGELSIAVLTALPVTACEVVPLGRAPGDQVARIAQVLTIELAEGPTVRLVNTHLTYALSSPLQLRTLLRWLYPRAARDPAPPRAQPTIIAGDLNMPRLAAASTPWFTGGSRPRVAPAVCGQTFPARRPVVQLDHILASREIDRMGGAVLGPAGPDHLPIRAQLSLQEHDPGKTP
jgi:endonuclease/exonuclease/phosphatase family metal-dependent hydrolase